MDGYEIAEVNAKFDSVHKIVEQAEEKDVNYINGAGYQSYNQRF